VTWWEAFSQAGHDVAMADIHRATGMGSDLMLDELLPRDRDKSQDDSLWDVQAAQKAGVRCVCLLSGGISRGELTDADATDIYDDPADLLSHFPAALIGSP